jgi:hypothetical protein
MAISTFDGPVRSLNGFYAQGPGAVVNVATGITALAVTVAAHAGRIIRVNDAAFTATLPTIVATADPASAGPGSDPNTLANIGASFHFFIETASTGVIFTTDGTDKFYGSVLTVDTDTSGAMAGFAPAATNDVCTFNGTTTGGIVGTWIKFTAIAAAKYLVQGVLLCSSTPATPFSDT